MRSQERRIEKLENKSLNAKKDVPDNLQGIYDWEQSEQGQKSIKALYNPNRKNPLS